MLNKPNYLIFYKTSHRSSLFYSSTCMMRCILGCFFLNSIQYAEHLLATFLVLVSVKEFILDLKCINLKRDYSKVGLHTKIHLKARLAL